MTGSFNARRLCSIRAPDVLTRDTLAFTYFVCERVCANSWGKSTLYLEPLHPTVCTSAPLLQFLPLPFLYRSYYTLITSFGIRSVVVGDTRGTSREKEAVSA